MKYVTTDLCNDSISKNVYDFIKAFVIYWSGLGIVYISAVYFQRMLGLPIVKLEKLFFSFKLLSLIILFPPVFILVIAFIASKNEVIVVKNKINFLNKVSEKHIDFKENDNLYYYLEIIIILHLVISLMLFKEMEASIMVGYSVGVRWVIANIKGEKEVDLIRRYISNIKKNF